MRFHVGFSKRISLKWILTIIGGALAFFGIFISARAESFTNLQNWSWCGFNASTYNASGCSTTTSSNIGTGTVNNISNVSKPLTAWYTSQGHTGKEKHTEFYKYGGTSDCSTGQSIQFYADVVLNDVNDTLPNNTLDYTQWPTSPVLRSGTRDLTYNNYYQWLANSSSDLTNRYGVSVSKSDGTSSSNCSFVSFGSNKSIRYLCSVASGNTGYQIKLNMYNNNGANSTNSSLSGTQVVSGVKVSVLNDPCLTQPNNNQGVIDSITGQTGAIVDGAQSIIDNQNSNSDRAHQDAEDIIDAIHNNTDTIHDDLTNKNQSINDSTGALGQFINGGHGEHQGFTDIIKAPIRLYTAIKNTDTSTCTGISLPIQFGGASQTAVLPCGAIMWDLFNEDAVAIYHIVVYGCLVFGAVLFSIRLYNDVLDPRSMGEIARKTL